MPHAATQTLRSPTFSLATCLELIPMLTGTQLMRELREYSVFASDLTVEDKRQFLTAEYLKPALLSCETMDNINCDNHKAEVITKNLNFYDTHSTLSKNLKTRVLTDFKNDSRALFSDKKSADVQRLCLESVKEEVRGKGKLAVCESISDNTVIISPAETVPRVLPQTTPLQQSQSLSLPPPQAILPHANTPITGDVDIQDENRIPQGYNNRHKIRPKAKLSPSVRRILPPPQNSPYTVSPVLSSDSDYPASYISDPQPDDIITSLDSDSDFILSERASKDFDIILSCLSLTQSTVSFFHLLHIGIVFIVFYEILSCLTSSKTKF